MYEVWLGMPCQIFIYQIALLDLVLEPSLAPSLAPSQLAPELDRRLSVRTSNEACIVWLIPAHLPLAFAPCRSAPYNGSLGLHHFELDGPSDWHCRTPGARRRPRQRSAKYNQCALFTLAVVDVIS